MKRILLSFAFAAACSTAVYPQSISDQLNEIFDADKWKTARWGVLVEDLETSEVLYARDPDKLFMPASNLKLYTTAAALSTLGADYKYETRIEAVGTKTSDGTLKGNLVIRGSGDPSISGRYVEDTPTTGILQTWAKAVKDAGINRIEGAVVGDDNVFDDSARAGSWQLSYYQEYYAAENSGLAINDNCWDVQIFPGTKVGAKARLETPQKSRYVTFENNVITTGPVLKASDTPTSIALLEEDEGVNLEIERDLDSNTITLSGTIALNASGAEEWGSLHNGTLYTATLLADELKRIGIRVDGGPEDIDDLTREVMMRLNRGRIELIHTHISPPLSRLIAIVNKPSQNFYADMMLKTLGKELYGRGTFSRGENVVRDMLTTAGVVDLTFAMSDGSGLSRQDMVQPRQTTSLLRYMASRPDAQIFEDSLPIMGVDGTLRTRLRDTPLHKNVKAKTGTIGGVRSLSGYMTTKSGRKLIFCMMANNYSVSTSQATEAQDDALKLLFNEGASEAIQTGTDETSAPTSNR